MCGRFTQTSSAERIAHQFDASEVVGEVPAPSYNVAPRSNVLVVRNRQREDESFRTVEPMRWGLVPSWATDPKVGDRQINARSETASSKPSYRQAIRRRRCIIPADGFYEWQRVGNSRKKRPMFIRRRDGQPLALAGLWEHGGRTTTSRLNGSFRA